jgi:outer membrane receptor protein involved in Fe transport
MVYARFATGFRPGGPNFIVAGVPPTFNPDTTQNYEVGIKSMFLDGRGMIDLSGYYTRWKDILVLASAGLTTAYGNGGDARVYGSEGTLTLEPVDGLTLAATLAYTEGEITKVNPAFPQSAAVGDPLPNNPRWSGSLSASYRAPVSTNWSMVSNATAKFADSRHAYFQSNTVLPDYVLPSYALIDLRTGLQGRQVDVDLFVRNLLDKRAQLSAYSLSGFPASNLYEVQVQRPRTIGVAVTYRY